MNTKAIVKPTLRTFLTRTSVKRTRLYSSSTEEPSCTSLIQEQLIVAETEESRCHLTPELRLRLITPSCRLWKAREEEIPFSDPFWAFYWPGGQALARYILDCPSVVRGARVLDLGCGGGGVGLAALAAGAARVVFNDVDPVALKAVEVNLKLNFGELNLGPRYQLEERSLVTCPAEQGSPPWDVVLVGDMFYDAAFAALLTDWLASLHSRGARIFIGDPGRSSFQETQAREEQRNDSKVHNHAKETRILKGSLAQEKLPLACVAKYTLLPHTVLENRGFSSALCWSTR